MKDSQVPRASIWYNHSCSSCLENPLRTIAFLTAKGFEKVWRVYSPGIGISKGPLSPTLSRIPRPICSSRCRYTASFPFLLCTSIAQLPTQRTPTNCFPLFESGLLTSSRTPMDMTTASPHTSSLLFYCRTSFCRYCYYNIKMTPLRERQCCCGGRK